MLDSDRLRLAIALIALRHKPVDQSCDSYVLELRQRFPSPNSKPASHVSDSSGPWHTRAIELEKTLRELQDKYDAQRVDLAASQVTPPLSIGDPDATPSCPAPTPVPGKKRSKKKATPSSVPTTGKTADASRADSMREPWTNLLVPDLSSPNQVLSSMEALDVLLDARRRRPPAATIDSCALAATRVLDAIATTLSALLPPTVPSAATSGVIQGLSTLVTRFLLATIPALSASRKKTDIANQGAPLDALLGNLVTSTLIPLLSNFYALSLAHLTALFPPPPASASRPKSRPKQPNHDVRPDALSFLRTTLQTLAELSQTTSGKPVLSALLASVHEALALSAVREIAKLYVPSPAGHLAPDAIGESACSSEGLPQTSTSQARPVIDESRDTGKGRATATTAQSGAPRGALRTERIEKLARKDALWYLCAVLPCAIPGASPTSEACSSSPALREGICTVLAGLLRNAAPARVYTRRGAGEADLQDGEEDERVQRHERAKTRGLLGGVEREMLLAVAEKVWLSQG